MLVYRRTLFVTERILTYAGCEWIVAGLLCEAVAETIVECTKSTALVVKCGGESALVGSITKALDWYFGRFLYVCVKQTKAKSYYKSHPTNTRIFLEYDILKCCSAVIRTEVNYRLHF